MGSIYNYLVSQHPNVPLYNQNVSEEFTYDFNFVRHNQYQEIIMFNCEHFLVNLIRKYLNYRISNKRQLLLLLLLLLLQSKQTKLKKDKFYSGDCSKLWPFRWTLN